MAEPEQARDRDTNKRAMQMVPRYDFPPSTHPAPTCPEPSFRNRSCVASLSTCPKLFAIHQAGQPRKERCSHGADNGLRNAVNPAYDKPHMGKFST